MMIKRLDSLSHNDTAATKTINDNFQALKEAVEDSLSRSGKTPNYMDADLDMNSRKIINVAEPVEAGDVVTLKYFKDQVGDAKTYSETAQIAAIRAESAAKSASIISQNINTNVKNIAEETAAAVVEEKTPDIVDEVLSKIEIPETSGGSVSYIFREVEFTPRQFDTVYEEYPYSYSHTLCDISDLGLELADALKGMDIFPTVTFSVEQADSGKFAPVADATWLRAVIPGSQADTSVGISIYSKEPITEPFIIPTIKLDVVQWLKV